MAVEKADDAAACNAIQRYRERGLSPWQRRFWTAALRLQHGRVSTWIGEKRGHISTLGEAHGS